MENKNTIPESKNIMQIATECNTRYNAVRDAIKTLGLVLEKEKVNKWQEELIHERLYLTGHITEIVVESKINKIWL